MSFAKALFFIPVLLTLSLQAAEPAKARLDNARIFPYFAAGGGWESTIMLLNLFEEGIDYRLSFKGINGQPAMVTFRDQENRIVTADNIQSRLNDDASHTIVILDSGALQTGWATLEYSGESRIAGVLSFRQRVAGRPDFESSVTLAREDETRVYLPFDNTLGSATTLALTNPSTSDNTDLRLRFWNGAGDEILTRDLRLAPGTTVAFAIAQQYPELAARSGQLRIEGSGNRLALLALRFNPGGSFTTIPVASR